MKPNYRYYLYTFYKDDIDFGSNTKLVDKIAIKPKNRIFVYRSNLYYI